MFGNVDKNRVPLLACTYHSIRKKFHAIDEDNQFVGCEDDDNIDDDGDNYDADSDEEDETN